MATAKQKAASRRNIKKAHAALRRKGRRKGTHGVAGVKGLKGLAGHHRVGRPRKKRRKHKGGRHKKTS